MIGLCSLCNWPELSLLKLVLVFIWFAKSSSYLFCYYLFLIFSYWSYYFWVIWYWDTCWLYDLLCSNYTDFLLYFSYICCCKYDLNISLSLTARFNLYYWAKDCCLAKSYCYFLTNYFIIFYFYWTCGAVLFSYTFCNLFWFSINWL